MKQHCSIGKFNEEKQEYKNKFCGDLSNSQVYIQKFRINQHLGKSKYNAKMTLTANMLSVTT